MVVHQLFDRKSSIRLANQGKFRDEGLDFWEQSGALRKIHERNP